MNSNDTTDTRKSELQATVDFHKDGLKNETLALGNRTQELIHKALIIGGSIAVAYFLYRQVTGKKKSGILNTLMMTAASALATEKGRELLISGKNKLTEYLDKEK